MEPGKKGPTVLPKDRVRSKGPPVAPPPEVPAAVLRQYARCAADRPQLAPLEPRSAPAFDLAAVEAAYQTVGSGRGTPLPSSPSTTEHLPVVIAPEVLEALDRSGLSNRGRERLFINLANNAGRKDALMRLPPWSVRPAEGRLYQTAPQDQDDSPDPRRSSLGERSEQYRRPGGDQVAVEQSRARHRAAGQEPHSRTVRRNPDSAVALECDALAGIVPVIAKQAHTEARNAILSEAISW
jgi:hypothetical protein